MRVLLVEDHAVLGDALQVSLQQAGFSVDWVRDGVAAEHALKNETFTAVVLDLGLPRRDGLEVLADLRQRGDRTPVLILTARDSVEDRIRGLDCGADDYLIKPVDMGELAARMRALVRRGAGQASPTLQIGVLQIDPVRHQVTRNDEEVSLSAHEFNLLHLLALNVGRVITKSQLEQQLYAWGEEVGSNTIEVFVHHLRRKLGTECIRTIRGVGYMLPPDNHA
jgi:DNA-binding response OmpR family regulator